MVDLGRTGLETIRVVIVSDEPEQTGELNILLQQAYLPLEVISTVGTKQCLQIVKDFTPDVVVFVDEGAKVPATEISREIYQKHPGTAIIIIASPTKQETPTYLRQALLAGAKDVLPFPPMLDTLVTSIQQAHHLERGRRPVRAFGRVRREEAGVGGRLILIYSPKGGAGRSFLAANLGVLLAQMNPGMRTILFDLDLQFGDQSVLLDLESPHSILDLLPVIDELTRDVVDSALASHPSGLRVLQAPPELQQADLIDAESIRKILVALRAYYDTVIIDTPAALTDLSLTAFEFADLILQICTPDVLAIRRTRASLELYDGLGIPRDMVRLVLNRTSKKSEIKSDEFRMLFEHEVIGEIPADFFFIQPYINIGVPLSEATRSAPIVQSLTYIAQQLAPTPQLQSS
jgi:pilus assembly protein CpaE